MIITALEVKTLAFNPGFDIENIKSEDIEVAETNHVAPKIGHDFYNYLCSLISPSPAESELLSRLKKAIAQYVKIYVLPEIVNPVGNNGIMMPSGQYNSGGNSKDKDDKVNNCLVKGDTLLSNAIDYIVANRGSFPKYWYNDGNNTLNEGANRLPFIFY